MAEKKFKFGQTPADDYKPAENGGSDVQWIRYFREAATQMRILPCVGKNAEGRKVYGADAWPTEREHYDGAIKSSYVCVREHDSSADCKGCKSKNERTRNRSRYWYVNALDANGVQRIWKIGSTVYKSLKNKQDRAIALDPDNKQPLSDRDFMVYKSGSGTDTTYEVEPGDKYQIDFPEEVYSISEALEAAWEEAMAKYSGDEPLEDEDEDVEPTRPAGRIGQTDHSKGEDKDDKGEESLPKKPTEEQIDSASTPQLREWLSGREVEFPRNAPRARLIKLALAELDNPPF